MYMCSGHENRVIYIKINKLVILSVCPYLSVMSFILYDSNNSYQLKQTVVKIKCMSCWENPKMLCAISNLVIIIKPNY